MDRVIEYLFFVYFVTHIPITIFIDAQAVIPRDFFPKPILDLVDWYCVKFKDVLMAESPTWFMSFVVTELLFQLPFFFVAVYALWKGLRNCQWIRLPFIVYSTHVATIVFCILFHIFTTDFKEYKTPGPTTPHEKLLAFLIYMPYLMCPLLILCDSLFSSVYHEKPKTS